MKHGGFSIDFTVNKNPNRKCIQCKQVIESGKLTMLVTHASNGVQYEGSYHMSCIDDKLEHYMDDDAKYTRLKERMATGARFFG